MCAGRGCGEASWGYVVLIVECGCTDSVVVGTDGICCRVETGVVADVVTDLVRRLSSAC